MRINILQILVLRVMRFHIDEEIAYEWIIDEELLEEWKLAKPGEKYQSDSFGVGGNWCLSMLPNGEDWTAVGFVILGLDSLRMSVKPEFTIECVYKLTLVVDGEELEFEEEAEFSYHDNDYAWIWPLDMYSNEKLQNVSSLQIYAKIWNIVRKRK